VATTCVQYRQAKTAVQLQKDTHNSNTNDTTLIHVGWACQQVY